MPCYLIFAENYPFNPEQVVLTKTWRNEGKIYQETDFFSTEGHLLTSSGCCLTLASMEVVQVIFLFANYLTYKSFAPFIFKIEMLQVLRTSCWVLLRVLLRSTNGISCRRHRLQHISIQFIYGFVLKAFVYILFLIHFTVLRSISRFCTGEIALIWD